MLEELIKIHQEVMASVATAIRRYLYDKINWNAQAICIFGDRGVGKTTLMCQRLLEEYKTVEPALYLSADNIYVTSIGLFKIAKEYIENGGEALFIDEVHKYPNWSVEIKNIIDTFKQCKVVFSASSSLELHQSKADLSRRVVYHHLLGLSFREYLNLYSSITLAPYSLEEIVQNHLQIAEKFTTIKVLKEFKNYLQYGYYPFFLEGLEDYLSKLNNVVEKVIFEDIAVVYNLRQTTLPVLKKLIWLVATTEGLTPNIDNISSNIGVSREVIYNCLEYLNQSGLIHNLYTDAQGMKRICKPGKIYLNNTNLLYAINSTLKKESGVGGARETFFANQVASLHKVHLHPDTDFFVDGKYAFEIGGSGKDHAQIEDLKQAYLAVDDTTIGYKNKIPLFLFGLLY